MVVAAAAGAEVAAGIITQVFARVVLSEAEQCCAATGTVNSEGHDMLLLRL